MDMKEAKAFSKIRSEYALKHELTHTKAFYFPREKTFSYQHGLSSQQAAIIIFIYHGGPKQINEIADYLKILPSNATKVSNTLVANGFCKKINENGKRAVFLDLTEEGRIAFEDDYDVFIEMLMEWCNKRLSPAEQKEYYRLYQRLNELTDRLLLKD